MNEDIIRLEDFTVDEFKAFFLQYGITFPKQASEQEQEQEQEQ